MQPIARAQVGALVNQYRFRLKAKHIGSVDVHHVVHSLLEGRGRTRACTHIHSQGGSRARVGLMSRLRKVLFN